jgi:hypothetical protein
MVSAAGGTPHASGEPARDDNQPAECGSAGIQTTTSLLNAV